MNQVDVTQFGADPVGQKDSFDSVQAAAATLREGDTLYFPPGTYWTRPRPANVKESFVSINQDNVSIIGPATLKNFMFNVSGTAGELHRVSKVIAAEGAAQLPEANQLNVGDYVQLLSARNAYSESAGGDQAGSRSPSSDILYPVRFSEFTQVRSVSERAIHFNQGLLFDQYDSARDVPAEDLAAPASELRRIQFISGIRISDLTFDMSGHRYFRTLRLRFTRDCEIESCTFIATDAPGRHLYAGDCIETQFTGNHSRRRPGADARGSSWNSFLFTAGCQDSLFANNRIQGDWQSVDFTSFGERDFGELESELSTWRTTQVMQISDNAFSDCNDGITTHPGTYWASIRGNTVRNSTNGARVRSRRNLVASNVFETFRTGVTLSSFFNESNIYGNTLSRMQKPEEKRPWYGLLILLTSQEVMTNNAIDRVLVTSNLFVDSYRESNSHAVFAFHDQRISERAKASFAEVSASRCDIVMAANQYGSLPITLMRDVHGIGGQ